MPGKDEAEHTVLKPGRETVPTSATMTATAPNTSKTSHALPPEKPQAIWTRTKVVVAFWAVIIFLGLPMWWKTTSIYRARLPLEEMMHWADGKACRPEYPLEIVLRMPSVPSVEAQNLLRTTQHALDDLNEFPAHHLRLKLVENPDTADSVRTTVPSSESGSNDRSGGNVNAALILNLIPLESTPTPKSELYSDSSQLDIFYPPSQLPSASSSNSPLVTYIAGEIQKLFSEEKATIAYILASSNSAGQSAPTGTAMNQQSQGNYGFNSISPELADLVSKRVTRSLKYADTYHLTFSLFTPGSQPSSWEIEAAIQDYLAPLLAEISPISNFSVDTQVQVYASFSPTSPRPEYDDSRRQWTLKQEDLSAFINAAEWPLSPSIGSGPTINFVLYVPAVSQSPLVVKDSQATSWIVPQWGGVAIVNPPLAVDSNAPINPSHLSKEALKPALLTFSHQLLTLLGTPATPSSLPLRLQSFIRIRTATLLLSASSTMGSLARLTQSLPSIPIPVTVASSVSTTLSHLTATCRRLQMGQFTAALDTARVAEKEAEKSFFEKSMVGQVYFPDEHKIAVYLPLLGPIGVPLVLGLVKECKRLIRDLKQRRSVTR